MYTEKLAKRIFDRLKKKNGKLPDSCLDDILNILENSDGIEINKYLLSLDDTGRGIAESILNDFVMWRDGNKADPKMGAK